jgi:CDP-diacylglycerol---serine O-phosphatidyltransferase
LRLIVPNVITVGGLLLGMGAILYAFQGQVVASAYLIIFASIVDTFDGAAARLLHASSAFGGYLDTLSDVVTVGVAPAVLVYAVYFEHWGAGGFLIASAWTVAVLMRLAYFQTTGKRDPLYFVGLPSPPAADILTGFVLLSSGIWHRYPYPWFVVALIVVLSFLMVSKLRVVKGAYFTPERIVRSWPGRLALLGVVFAAVYPWAAPLVVFSTVLLLAIFRDLLVRVRNFSQRTAPAGIGDMDGVAANYRKEG